MFVPIEAPFFIIVGITCQSFSVCSFPFEIALGYLSLMNLTPWPMKTLSSIVTPSQIKE